MKVSWGGPDAEGRKWIGRWKQDWGIINFVGKVSHLRFDKSWGEGRNKGKVLKIGWTAGSDSIHRQGAKMSGKRGAWVEVNLKKKTG
jgi:hypothetical protein